MILAISTVKRPKNSAYLDRCIKSIRQDYEGIIHLMIGGKDTSYTDKYTKGFVKHKIGQQEERYEDVIQKAAYGYYRCLTIDVTEPTLVFEDDAVLVEGWYSKMKNLLTFIADDMYALSLIVPFDGAVPVPSIDIPSVQPFLYYAKLDYATPGELPSSTIATYCNTTGVYYPSSLLMTRFPEFIYRFAVKDQTVHDLAMGQFMFRYNLPINIAVPPLLKNVDSTDSSLGSIKRRMHVDYSDWDYKKL